MSSDEIRHFLRRTIAPYIGQTVAFAAAAALVAVVYLTVLPDWKFVVVCLSFIMLGYGLLYDIGVRYRIYWTGSEICQTAVGKPEERIKYSEISAVVSELPDNIDLVTQSRPFQRIAIYAPDERDPEGKSLRWIDLSLRHFRRDDVAELIEFIHRQRPDLEMPRMSESTKRARKMGRSDPPTAL